MKERELVTSEIRKLWVLDSAHTKLIISDLELADVLMRQLHNVSNAIVQLCKET